MSNSKQTREESKKKNRTKLFVNPGELSDRALA